MKKRDSCQHWSEGSKQGGWWARCYGRHQEVCAPFSGKGLQKPGQCMNRETRSKGMWEDFVAVGRSLGRSKAAVEKTPSAGNVQGSVAGKAEIRLGFSSECLPLIAGRALPVQGEVAGAVVSCPAEGGALSGAAGALAQGVSPRSPVPRVCWTSPPL